LKYSPYQNLRAGVKYPPVLFVTSTADDRVHPGHARKMAARLRELAQADRAAHGEPLCADRAAHGEPLCESWLFENIEGGHSAAANIEQRAHRLALTLEFWFRKLVDAPAARS
jgi:prolyl oligopeptidase